MLTAGAGCSEPDSMFIRSWRGKGGGSWLLRRFSFSAFRMGLVMRTGKGLSSQLHFFDDKQRRKSGE